MEDLSNFMIIYHCVFSGLIADEYFLIEHNLFPALPQLIPNLLSKKFRVHLIFENVA
ncbi:MAG: hypothetical protein F6K49_50730 [Moorea sp. SIO3I6]|nr:hypothetical protein [Moorena sp. SIO3I6]